MPWKIVKTRKSPPGYRVQKLSDKSYMSSYDMTLDKAKAQLAAILISEHKKYKKPKNKT
jgi:hypothetical protein